ARIGGDEFAVLASQTGPTSRQDITHRLKNNLDAERNGDPRYLLSLSVGSAKSNPQSSVTLDSLLNRADRAMYAIKRARHKARLSVVPSPPRHGGISLRKAG